ncbi:MAG: DedA family protein [Desulfobulbaceae bacterium]|uniref:DedA family protein n=1 Tax=Candidatus Desulfatifera sulfidica TaxID=2841691 RepID=A0A8J6NA17_9BACT|nr:DedA family protein [Candidatus Desulfatifera sulfidica]
MEWIQTPYGLWALFLIAFVESSFFPIPPDVFLIALCLAAPHKAFRYAAICAVGSALGGAFGYGLGMWFMDSVGVMVMNFYGLTEKYEVVQELYQKYDVWAVGTAGFTPLPYKLFTITAGAFHLNFPTFLLVSFVSRAARFFLVAAFIWRFGAPVRYFLEKYFNLLSILFMVLLVGGFVLIKMLL